MARGDDDTPLRGAVNARRRGTSRASAARHGYPAGRVALCIFDLAFTTPSAGSAQAVFMRARTLVLVSALHLIACGGSSPTLQTDGQLRVSRVVLFQNGMAYFEHRGATEGRSLDLTTRTSQVDDVLKSLALVDDSGARVSSVRVMATTEGSETTTLRVGLAGEGRHDVALSYVAEASGWRPTYRLVTGPEGEVRLLGLAVVDNHSGETWDDISLALSTELPLSFEYNLNAPRVANRPRFSADGRLVLTPPAESELLAVAVAGNDVQAGYAFLNAMDPEESNRAGRRVGAVRNDGTAAGPAAGAGATPGGEPIDAMAALDARDPAAGFVLESPERFSLADGESGLVPFVDRVVPGDRVLLYKPSSAGGASQTRPYHAVLFENPLDAPLLTGPVSVYSQDSFLGDGVTGTVPARAHAFLAYASEPSVRVGAGIQRTEDEIRGLRVTAGRLEVELQAVIRHTFDVHSSMAWTDRLFLFVPLSDGFEPRDLPEGSIVSGAGYFIPAEHGVTEEHVSFDLVRQRTVTVDLAADPTHDYVPALLRFLEGRSDSDVSRLREITNRLTELADLSVALERDLAVHRRALEERRDALEALRHVAANSGLRRRIGQSVADGVQEVDDITRRRVEANAERVELRQEWYARLREL